MGDQVHIDLIEIEDKKEKRFYVVHATDSATRFQAAQVMEDKSTKSVVHFLATRWLPTFGAPRVLVCDQGREFVSWQMEEMGFVCFDDVAPHCGTGAVAKWFSREVRWSSQSCLVCSDRIAECRRIS